MVSAPSKVFLKNITLNNGVEIPMVGYGTYDANEEEMDNCLKKFYEIGGRHIDTARFYGNEKTIGNSIKKLGIDRKTLFITSKVWFDAMGTEETIKSVQDSMADLQTDYLDLVLIHWPMTDKAKRIECYRGLEQLYEQKKIRAIGISNFYDDILTDFLKEIKVRPAVNQIEVNPLCFRKSALEQNAKEGIVLTAYTPLARFKPEVIGNPVIVAIGAKYNKKPTQVILRWLLEHNIVVVPKSSNLDRIQENMEIGDFELTPEEVAKIDASCTDDKLINNNRPMLGFQYNSQTEETMNP